MPTESDIVSSRAQEAAVQST